MRKATLGAGDGGREAARGLQYQYLATLEALVDHVDVPAAAAVRVEGDPASQVADIVDYEILDAEGRTLLAAQVKSKARLEKLSASAAFEVLGRLAAQCDADSYLLQCSARPGAGAVDLVRALTSGRDAAHLRAVLGKLLAASPARRSQLDALEREGKFDRLLRARLVYDTRTDEELRAELKGRLRRFRNAARVGLGEQSAGLLTGHLVAEIMRRAADGLIAGFQTEELRSLLLIDGDVLASASAVRDWAVVVGAVPPFPDVRRDELFGQITAVLPHPAPKHVRRVALTGLSGVGKSALAADYIAENAQMYDYVFWVDAASEASLASGFRSIALALLGARGADQLGQTVDELRGGVLTNLGRLAGRWLLVFDSADTPVGLRPWAPVHGAGDVILTSVDSTARFAHTESVAVPTFTSAQSARLLASRLHLDEVTRERFSTGLKRLADELEHWPLALELACAYMTACGLGPGEADAFLRDLKLRALADEYSVPDGYPRTLAAALGMALAGLVTSAKTGEEAAGLALRMLYCAAHLAQRQIPVYLLAGVSEIDAWRTDLPERGSLVPAVEEVNSLEGARALLRFSLVAWDEDLPQSWPDSIVGEAKTLSINAVVADMLRAQIAASPHTPTNLANTAAHLERWLAAAVDGTHFPRALALLTHAESLAAHLRRLDVRGWLTALLYGNMAATCLMLGRNVDAAKLLGQELDLLSDDPDEHIHLQAQAHLALGRVRLRLAREPETVRLTVESFEHLLALVHRLASDAPEHAADLCATAATLLRRYPRPSALENAANTLVEVFLDLHRRLDPTAVAQATMVLDDFDLKLNKAGPADAARIERECRRILDEGVLEGQPRVQAIRLIIEALICQEQWGRARSELVRARGEALSHGLTLRQVAMLANNIGLTCMTEWMIKDERRAVLLLDDVMSWPETAEAQDRMEPHWAHRLQLLSAVHQASCGAPDDAQQALARLRPDDLCENPATEMPVWTATLFGLNARVAELAVIRPARTGASDGQAIWQLAGLLPWDDADFTRCRQADVRWLKIVDGAETGSLVQLLLPYLAYTLGSGVRRVPCIDLSFTLCHAFALLGIKARPKLANLTLHDKATGARHTFGHEPGWGDRGFTGHCVVVLDDPTRLVDLTVEQLPGLFDQHMGPVIARGTAVTVSGTPVSISAEEGLWTPLLRDPFAILHTFEPENLSERILRQSTYVAENADHYRQAGRRLASAAVNVLSLASIDAAALRAINQSAATAVERARGCRVETDGDGNWHFVRGDRVNCPDEEVEVFSGTAPFEA